MKITGVLLLVCLVAVGTWGFYVQEKSKFENQIDEYVLNLNSKTLDQLYLNKIPVHQKKYFLIKAQQKYNCKMAFIVAAVATMRQKKIITTADLNNCYINYYSQKEAAELASVIRKLSEGATQISLFGSLTSVNEEAMLKAATIHSKFIENVISIDAYFKQKEVEEDNAWLAEKGVPKNFDEIVKNNKINQPQVDEKAEIKREAPAADLEAVNKNTGTVEPKKSNKNKKQK